MTRNPSIPHSPRILWPMVWNPFPSLPFIISLGFEFKESEVRCICRFSSTDADRSSSVLLFHREPNTWGPVQYQLVHEIMKHMLSTLLFPILHWGSSPGISLGVASSVLSHCSCFSVSFSVSSAFLSWLWSLPIFSHEKESRLRKNTGVSWS